MKQSYFYLYKITNKINNRVYYGKHSTSQVNDRYFGSGILLKKAIKKYGKKNFIKEIITFYNSQEELDIAEKNLITEDVVNDPLTYNMALGGKGSFYAINYGVNSETHKEKCQMKVKSYCNRKEVKEQRRKRMINYHNNLTKDERQRIKEKEMKTKSLHSAEYKEQIEKQKAESFKKNFVNSENGQAFYQGLAKRQSGYNNNIFKSKFKKFYDDNMTAILDYILYSNLPDTEIPLLFSRSTRHFVKKIMQYAEHCGFIKDIKKIYAYDYYSKNNLMKTVAVDLRKNQREIFYRTFKFIDQKAINIYNSLIQLLYDENITDSQIKHKYNSDNIGRYLPYFKDLGLLDFYIRKQKPKKTIVELNKSFKQNYFLVEKGNPLKRYSIQILDDGLSIKLEEINN